MIMENIFENYRPIYSNRVSDSRTFLTGIGIYNAIRTVGP